LVTDLLLLPLKARDRWPSQSLSTRLHEVASSDPVPELVSGYQTARLQVVVSAGLLLLWWAGIHFEGTLPVLGVKVPASEKVAPVLGAVMAYGVGRLIIEWFQSNPTRRRRLVSRVDIGLTLGIAAGTAWLTGPKILAAFWWPPVWLLVPVALLIALGIYAGTVTAGFMKTLVFIRSKEEAARLSLPRHPVVTRSMFKWWCHVMALLGVVILLSPGFAAPLSYLWFWFLGVPLGVPILTEAAVLSRSRRRRWLKTFQSIVDSHDAAYQLGGWDKRIPSSHSPLFAAANSGDVDESGSFWRRARNRTKRTTTDGLRC
jgi:hypothetical protein